MTSRCYFGKMNSILGSVVPLAMFGKEIFAYFRVLAAMIPSFGAKKAAPAFQVKKALTTGNNSSIASIKNLSDGSTPGNPTTATSIETTDPSRLPPHQEQTYLNKSPTFDKQKLEFTVLMKILRRRTLSRAIIS